MMNADSDAARRENFRQVHEAVVKQLAALEPVLAGWRAAYIPGVGGAPDGTVGAVKSVAAAVEKMEVQRAAYERYRPAQLADWARDADKQQALYNRRQSRRERLEKAAADITKDAKVFWENKLLKQHREIVAAEEAERAERAQLADDY